RPTRPSDMVLTMQLGAAPPASAPDPDEALSLRPRDLSLVDLDALTAGAREPGEQVAAYAEDAVEALTAARARIAALRASLGGPDPLNVLELSPRQRASDAGATGAERVRSRLTAHAEAARNLAR